MPMVHPTLPSVIPDHLKRLAMLRLITSSGVAIALMMLGLHTQLDMQTLSAWTILTAMVALSLANVLRASKTTISPYEVFSYLLLDTLLIAALMYVTGGANNPFITYLLVPIVISAATLNWLFTWILCVLAMSVYGLLLFLYLPLYALDQQLAELGLSLHIIGMWFTFVLSALLIAYFVVDMAQDLASQAKRIEQLNQQSLQHEHVLLLASQAASTAHALGTPLTTINMLAHELQAEANISAQCQADLALIEQQVNVCKSTLKQLTQHTDVASLPKQSVQQFIADTLDQWQLMRPNVQFTLEDFSSKQGQPIEHTQVQYSLLLRQSIINLLDNAADSQQQAKRSNNVINLNLHCLAEHWQLDILDAGNGFENPNESVTEIHANESVNGLGIGLLLSYGSIQRFGGNVSWENQQPIGCLTKIEMPYHA